MSGLARRFIRLARALPIAFTALFALIQFTPVTAGLARRMAIWDDPAPASGVLIVLGAEQHADGTLGIMSYWRCFYALRAWRTGRFSKVLVSGGPVQHPGPPEQPPPPLADSMAAFLQAMGVPAGDIVIERASSSTHLNAVNSVPLLRGLPGPYTLITSDYHTLRAQRTFRRAGLAVSSQPAPDILKRSSDWRQRFQCSAVLAEEWVKLGYYWWQGWI